MFSTPEVEEREREREREKVFHSSLNPNAEVSSTFRRYSSGLAAEVLLSRRY
jgi:hypothetical protein